ncbi:conserved domain protein [Paraprevotella xylaniphila YIT 11841]|uniref:Conserved domain protein n=2 Tax=Paraprevotella xylaniphila TaxID=454155 RepID=F3QTK8_9BACT|nr:conserved domain protein [Paraprevotella xylaniphila YIT 11841]
MQKAIIMNTLQIDSVLLDEALKMAKQKNIDLSQMVESFIRNFVERSAKPQGKSKITPYVSRLGIDLDLPADFDEREAYRKYLEEKYG